MACLPDGPDVGVNRVGAVGRYCGSPLVRCATRQHFQGGALEGAMDAACGLCWACSDRTAGDGAGRRQNHVQDQNDQILHREVVMWRPLWHPQCASSCSVWIHPHLKQQE